MAFRVSISLPGGTIITFEATDPQVFREIVSLALKELPRDLAQIQMESPVAGASPVPDASMETGQSAPSRPLGPDGTGYQRGRPIRSTTPAATPERIKPGLQVEQSFAQFCGALSPLGDMRRAVVAVEGARRFLDMDNVSERELGGLFDLMGWRQPGDLVQTLRNAARSKFRWLERVPGSPGYYAVTKTGRDVVIGGSGT